MGASKKPEKGKSKAEQNKGSSAAPVEEAPNPSGCWPAAAGTVVTVGASDVSSRDIPFPVEGSFEDRLRIMHTTWNHRIREDDKNWKWMLENYVKTKELGMRHELMLLNIMSRLGKVEGRVDDHQKKLDETTQAIKKVQGDDTGKDEMAQAIKKVQIDVTKCQNEKPSRKCVEAISKRVEEIQFDITHMYTSLDISQDNISEKIKQAITDQFSGEISQEATDFMKAIAADQDKFSRAISQEATSLMKATAAEQLRHIQDQLTSLAVADADAATETSRVQQQFKSVIKGIGELQELSDELNGKLLHMNKDVEFRFARCTKEMAEHMEEQQHLDGMVMKHIQDFNEDHIGKMQKGMMEYTDQRLLDCIDQRVVDMSADYQRQVTVLQNKVASTFMENSDYIGRCHDLVRAETKGWYDKLSERLQHSDCQIELLTAMLDVLRLDLNEKFTASLSETNPADSHRFY